MANTKLINTGIEFGEYTELQSKIVNSGIEIADLQISQTKIVNAGIEVGDFGAVYFDVEKAGITDVYQNNKGWHQNAKFELLLNPFLNNRLNSLVGYASQMTWAVFKAFLDANPTQLTYAINQNRIENVAFDLTNSSELSEHKKIKVNRETCQNPIYLTWLNSLGAWEYWLFTGNQKYSLNTENSEIVANDYTDLSLQTMKEYVLNKKAVEKIECYAEGVEIANKEAFKQLLSSIRVNMLTSLSPIAWQTVIVDSGSFEIYESQNDSFDISFTIILPSKNLQC